MGPSMAGGAQATGIAEIEWSLEPARNGAQTLCLGGRPVHSRYDPGEDARQLAERWVGEAEAAGAEVIACIGSGLGLVPAALRQQTARPPIVWDPFPGVTEALTERGAHCGEGIACVRDPAGFEDALSKLPADTRVHLAVHPGHGQLCGFEVRYALRALRRRLAPRDLRPEAAVVSERALAALQRFPHWPTYDTLGTPIAGRTAIIVAPGPSLARALPALRRRRGGVVLAAVQALRPLAEAGVRVDFAVAPDPRDYSAHLEEVDAEVGALLAETSAHPRLEDEFRNRLVAFHLRSPQLHHLAWEQCGLPVLDEPFVTVSETALVLAHRLGARRFALLGVDLASEDPGYPVRFRTPSAQGDPTWTNATYFHAARYLSWWCEARAREGCEIRRPREGLGIAGTRELDLPELEAQLATEAPCGPLDLSTEDISQRRACADRLLRQAMQRGAQPPQGCDGVPALQPLAAGERERACAHALAALRG